MNTDPARRIHLVDDDAPTARVVRLSLAIEGLPLEMVASRDEALASIGKQPPDVLIMDYLMPGLSAADFIARAREAGFVGPILLCTAMDGQIDLPVDGVIRKPFDPDELAATVKALLPGPAPA